MGAHVFGIQQRAPQPPPPQECFNGATITTQIRIRIKEIEGRAGGLPRTSCLPRTWPRPKRYIIREDKGPR